MRHFILFLLSFLVSISILQAQSSTTVKGTVVDEMGEVMIGVSVVLKSTITGTVTDFDGKFTLNIPSGDT